MEPQDVIRWVAHEHKHEAKGADWYWALGIIAVSAALTSILFANVLFAILILAAALTLGLIANKDPETTEFEINERGLRVGDDQFLYKDLRVFWIIESMDGATLLADTPRMFNPDLVIPLEGVDPSLVRERLLVEQVEESELTEPFAYRFLEALGF